MLNQFTHKKTEWHCHWFVKFKPRPLLSILNRMVFEEASFWAKRWKTGVNLVYVKHYDAQPARENNKQPKSLETRRTFEIHNNIPIRSHRLRYVDDALRRGTDCLSQRKQRKPIEFAWLIFLSPYPKIHRTSTRPIIASDECLTR